MANAKNIYFNHWLIRELILEYILNCYNCVKIHMNLLFIIVLIILIVIIRINYVISRIKEMC